MFTQHQVIASIGTNIGDRKGNIVSAIENIQLHVGTVIKVSRIFESPSWGFEGDFFYNVIISIHTIKSPKNVLNAFKKIEHNLGREAKTSQEYESRIIDIDIVTFDDKVVQTSDLQIPHPRMHERNFVLLPLQDVLPDFIHPVSKLKLKDMISQSNDESSCIPVSSIENPSDKYTFKNLNFITIEGNIGVGKTTLAHKIAQDFNGKLLLERFADNPFLPLFYQNQERYAFSLEMSFLAERYQQVSDDLAQLDLFNNFIISDYHMYKSLIFAKVTLAEVEFNLYRKLFDIIYKEIPKPDLYIYLYQNPDRLLQNIKKRGRDYEATISEEYLLKINKGYLDFLKSQSQLNVLIIDVSEMDFVDNQSDYLKILDLISKKHQEANQY